MLWLLYLSIQKCMYIVGMVIVNLISVLQFVNLHYSNTLIPEQ